MKHGTKTSRRYSIQDTVMILIGVIGSKEDAEMIKAEVKKFLAEELNLTLSDEKTKITHTSECADFLGYKIKVSRNEGIKRRKDGIKSRPFSGVVKLYVPKENWVKKLLEYEAIKIVTDEMVTRNGKPCIVAKF